MRRRTFGTVGAFVVLLALTLGAPAEGALRPEFSHPDATTWNGWRSFRFRPALALKDFGWDSNVFLDPVGGDQRGDLTATISPSGQALLQFGQSGFVAFKAGIDYVWFSQYSEQTHINLLGGVKGNLNFRVMRLYGELEYQRQDERPSNAIDERTRRSNANLNTGIGFDLSGRMSIDLIAGRNQIDYADEDFLNTYACKASPIFPYEGCPSYTLDELLSRDERTATLRVTRAVGGRSGLALDVGLRRYAFSGPRPDASLYDATPVVGSVRDTDEGRATLGFELAPGGLLHGSLRVGVTDFRPLELTDQAVTEPVWLIDLRWRLGERVALKTAFDRDLYFSIYGSNINYRQTHKELQSVFYVSRVFALEASYETYELFYPVVDPTLDPLYDDPRIDDIRNVRAGLRFKVRGASVATLRVGQRRRVSNFPGIDNNQWLVTTGVERQF